jgi:hypothetical protein
MRWVWRVVAWVFGARHKAVPASADVPIEPVGPEVGEVAVVAPKRRTANPCTLWPVTNTDRRRKLWCGPTVVSALIGIDAAAARDIIKESRGGRAVMGTTARELDLDFRARGYWLDLLTDYSSNSPTFATWLRLPRDPDHALVVQVTGHWLAVRGNWFCDTSTKGQPVKVRHAPHKRKRVPMVYRLNRL